MTQSNTRSTYGSILGAVDSVATSVGSTFDTVTKSIGMANQFVTNASKQQLIRNRIENVDFSKRLVQECALATATREREILTKTSADPEFKKLYDINQELFASALKDSEQSSDTE